MIYRRLEGAGGALGFSVGGKDETRLQDILAEIFASNYGSDLIYGEIEHVVRDIPALRKKVRNRLIQKGSDRVAYVLRPELAEDREILNRMERKTPLEKDLIADLAAYLKKVEKDHPMDEAGNYYKNIAYSLNRGERPHAERSSEHVQKEVSRYQELFKTRRFLNKVGDGLSNRLTTKRNGYLWSLWSTLTRKSVFNG